MHTPDSRIAHDWNPDGTPYDTTDRHLGPMTHRPAAEPNFIFAREDFMQKLASATSDPIDTSTTAGKISVLQHYVNGGHIQMMTRGRHGTDADDGWGEPWRPIEGYRFNWERYNYRIAPPPPVRTALQLAREYLKTQPHEISGGSADGRILALVEEIDSCVTMTVHGDGHLKQVHMGLGAMQPGRYRLLRDDQ